MSSFIGSRPPRRLIGLALAFTCLLAISTAAADAAPGNTADEVFREGWRLLDSGEHHAARLKFEAIQARQFEPGDYVLFFRGLCLAREEKVPEALSLLETLKKSYPASPLVAYLRREIAFTAARTDQLALAGQLSAEWRGREGGATREPEQAYIAARLREEASPAEGAELHLKNAVEHPGTRGAALSVDRLWRWRDRGFFAAWSLSLDFYRRLAQVLAKGGDYQRSRAIYAEAMGKFFKAEGYHEMILEFAESLRRQGYLTKARTILESIAGKVSPSLRPEVDLLLARIDWKAGRFTDARRTFLGIAERSGPGLTGDRARYQAALIAEREGDYAAATMEFGRLQGSADREIREEASFRHAFGLYDQKRIPEAIAAFEAGEKGGSTPLEKARHAFWRARCLLESGDKDKAGNLVDGLASDAAAGPYSLLALRLKGLDPYAILNEPSPDEPLPGRPDWGATRLAVLEGDEFLKFQRVWRLVELGVGEYAIREAEQLSPDALPTMPGLPPAAAAALLAYLSGDLRRGIREASRLPSTTEGKGYLDVFLYPLTPEAIPKGGWRDQGVHPLLVHAVIRQESLFQVNCVSPAGAVGLMQLMPATAAQVARKLDMRDFRGKDLLRPRLNVLLGTDYLAGLVKRCQGDYFRAVAAYNAGERPVAEWWNAAAGDPAVFLERITYSETRGYVRRVFANLIQYFRIYRPTLYARYFPGLAAGKGTKS